MNIHGQMLMNHIRPLLGSTVDILTQEGRSFFHWINDFACLNRCLYVLQKRVKGHEARFALKETPFRHRKYAYCALLFRVIKQCSAKM